MAEDEDTQKSDKTTANTPVSDIGPGGTRPAPSGGKPERLPIKSGDQNTNPGRGTDR
jgi:hypothetical protein